MLDRLAEIECVDAGLKFVGKVEGLPGFEDALGHLFNFGCDFCCGFAHRFYPSLRVPGDTRFPGLFAGETLGSRSAQMRRAPQCGSAEMAGPEGARW